MRHSTVGFVVALLVCGAAALLAWAVDRTGDSASQWFERMMIIIILAEVIEAKCLLKGLR